LAAGGFALDFSSPIDSATSASSTTARTPARKLRDPSTPRFGGIRRRGGGAPAVNGLKRRSSSERFREGSAATEPDPTPVPLDGNARVEDDPCVQSILDAIGNTPLLRLRRCLPANGAELWLKLE
jgi:hypothetical protein